MKVPVPEGQSTYGTITLDYSSRKRESVQKLSDFLATLSKVSRCCEAFSIEIKTPKNGSEKLELSRKDLGLCGVKVEENLYKAQDNENEIEGGLADGKTCEDIAKKHKVSLESIKEELKRGMEVEKEHTSDEEKAKEIAMDHIFESPTYYQDLAKIEKGEKEVEEAMKHPDEKGEGAKKRKGLSKEDKIATVMKEFERGTLHSGSGEIVTDRDQALAIAMSESEKV